ncbi:MAG TPA: N-acetylmuramoyl-L-alanine amidase [Candidatus Eremiobacteraceae bacterium]|nr:N-acetylmuramoyl-L-alanine amidase [Candidatus Eremiobacteraceae bacterium]
MYAHLKSPTRPRCRWQGLFALAIFAALTPALAHARARHSDAWAREHFAAAERMREALNGRPSADRTRHDYQRVLNAYRNVYLGSPASSKADPSVVAVAETLVEMGRRFEDDKILHEAIEQYKFLRREYPGSKYRFDGLFTIGEIYKDDLNQPETARATFEDFLRRYPNNRLADGARQAIVEIKQQAQSEKTTEAKNTAEKRQSENSGKNKNNNKEGREVAAEHSVSQELSGKNESPIARSGLPRVTGIRHWSTPDYTRVAIDVESDVKFSSRRIARPSRIFFDLHETKLASTLVGKTLDVDDGFLKKIRVAQFAPRRTRVVLEVDNLSDYHAFLLSNPCRLIIDIHGKNGRGKLLAKLPENADETSEDITASAKNTSDSSDDSNSSDAMPAASAHAPSSGKAAASARAEVDDETTAVSEPSSVDKKLDKKPQTAVVKKVVDADDEDDVASAPVQAPDLSVAQSGRSSLDNAHRKSSVRPLASANPDASDLGIREAGPTVSGNRSLIRALGLKIGKIVIDPGHGGHDTGTIGPNGLEEKDLVLEVGRRLGKLLETRLGAEVVYTRKNDTFIPLETRTAIANQARADLFVSIHANSSHDADARGVETYYLNFTSSPEALEVAARENAVSEKSIYELQDLVKKIALKEKIEESREFAWDVQQSLHSGLAVKSPAIRDRGVKKAPFIVLIGANMPSILAEISFVSNPTDEHRLATSEYRQRIAESLYRGIAKYVNGLSGVKVASKMDKAAGQ